MSGAAASAGGSDPLYTALAPDYDAQFEAPTHRRAYEQVALRWVDEALDGVGSGATILDVGCGTGRTARRWLEAGHRVVGVERAPGMIAVLRGRGLGPRFRLVEGDMDALDLPADALGPDGADLAVALGSLQYARDPAAALARIASLVRPGGRVLVQVDGRIGLAAERLRAGDEAEGHRLLETGIGRFRAGGHTASLALLTAASLRQAFEAAGLGGIAIGGTGIGAVLWGRDGLAARMREDETHALEREYRMSREPGLADLGLHLIAVGRVARTERDPGAEAASR